MSTDEAGIGVGCTTCDVELHLDSRDEHELRRTLSRFFEAHASCHVYVDVSRTAVPLPPPPT